MDEFTRKNLVSMRGSTRGIPWQIAITIRKGHLEFVTEADDHFGDDEDGDDGGGNDEDGGDDGGDADDMRVAKQIECGRL